MPTSCFALFGEYHSSSSAASKLSQLRYPEALSAVMRCNVVQEGVCSSHRSRMKIRWEPYSYDELLGCMYLVVKVHASSWFASIWQHSAKAFARSVILRYDGG